MRAMAQARVGVMLVRLLVIGMLSAAVLTAASPSAFGAQAWRLDSLANTSVAPGETLDYLVQATNVGDASMDGSRIDLVARLPTGMTAVSASLTDAHTGHIYNCFDARDGVSPVAGAGSVICSNNEPVPWLALANARFQKLTLRVSVAQSAPGRLTTAFSVTGGGAPTATTADPTIVTSDPPHFGVDAFDGLIADAGGDAFMQAGGRPVDVSVSTDFNTTTSPVPLLGTLWPVEGLKDVVVDLPPGLVGDPTVVDQCTLPQLANAVVGVGFAAHPLCSPTSQVGTILLRVKGGPTTSNLLGPLPVFNLVPPPGVPAEFGFNALGTVVTLSGTVRTKPDYGISVVVPNAPQALAIISTTVDFWGVPFDSSHDADRACPDNTYPADGGPTCSLRGALLKPFFRYPTSCGDPGQGLPFVARIDSWQHPEATATASWSTHRLPGYPLPPEDWGPQVGPQNCTGVPFDPVFRVRPNPDRAGGPAGFGFDLSVPQDDTAAVGQSDLRSATVTLPEGVRVNPSSADGLQGCSPAQIGLDTTDAPSCPDGSKLGSVTIDTPLLRVPVTGSIYLATPFDNPAHSLISLYLVASAQGVTIKLAGQGTLNPDTGQVSTTFDNSPQLPFSNLHLELDGGPRAPLTIPDRCGVYTTHVVLTGWNGRTVSEDPTFTVDQNGSGQPCPAVFSPGFAASTLSNSAGSSSSFLLRLTRGDEDQQLAGLTVDMPSGLTGRIASAELCSDAAANAASCPDGSKIGDVVVGAGSGPNPFYVTNGRAYLTGPYKGAPFGVAIVVRAVAGPFDLGNVVVRSALFVDKQTADVRIVSDPLPTILQGIPLDVRDVRVDVNKPGFFLNPTGCQVKTIRGTIVSTAGASANVSDRFQAADCASLGFAPKMVIRVGGRGHTGVNRTSPLTTRVTMPRGDSNLRSVRVVLPGTLNARLNVISDSCTRAEFESDLAKCAHAQAGTAIASTPLLRDPLKGGVYFVKSPSGRGFPNLIVALRGQVAFDLVGRILVLHNKFLGTVFDTAPDVPIRSFVLSLFGGSHTASIGVLTNLCSAKARRTPAQLDYIAQNGATRHVNQRLVIEGCGGKRHKH